MDIRNLTSRNQNTRFTALYRPDVDSPRFTATYVVKRIPEGIEFSFSELEKMRVNASKAADPD